jgi:hypothetical protein
MYIIAIVLGGGAGTGAVEGIFHGFIGGEESASW